MKVFQTINLILKKEIIKTPIVLLYVNIHFIRSGINLLSFPNLFQFITWNHKHKNVNIELQNTFDNYYMKWKKSWWKTEEERTFI